MKKLQSLPLYKKIVIGCLLAAAVGSYAKTFKPTVNEGPFPCQITGTCPQNR